MTTEAGDVAIRPENRRAAQFRELPSRARTVPVTSIYSGQAIEPIRRVVTDMLDFRAGGPNTVGQGSRMQILQEIGAGGTGRGEGRRPG